MVDIKGLQNNIDRTNEKVDEYSFYDKAIPNSYQYKLTRAEYYNLNMDEKRDKEETQEQYKLRRNKIKHYRQSCTCRIFWPSNALGTYNLHDEQRMKKQIEAINNLVNKQKTKITKNTTKEGANKDV